MSKFNADNFIKKYSSYQKAMYIFGIIAVALCGVISKEYPSNIIATFSAVMTLFFIADIILYVVNYFDSSKLFLLFRYVELITFCVLQAMANKSPIIVAVATVFIIIEAVEFVLYKAEYDVSMINMRRYSVILPMVVNLFVVEEKTDEYIWVIFAFLHCLTFIVISIIIEWFVYRSEKYEKTISNINLELSRSEEKNVKLKEFQDRVKMTNEQMNYQKIELTKANKELEQANLEIESQTEMMKYMASTFDIPKCINYITDAVMEVKKSKVCAIYIEKDVYMNQFPSCSIKTNYSSMHRRLNKEIESIYDRVSNNNESVEIIVGDATKNFKFIGDANINAVALLPFSDGKACYGMMLVGSDDVAFFKKGMNYYENCIVEFNVAMNSTKMYLAMEDMARKDGLTGIFNRVYFKQLFSNAVKEIKRKKQPISVALFDIDKFKKVNDTYGHLAGDKVIQMVASIGQEYAQRHGGFTCRYGGEEFLLVLPGYDKESALPILEELHDEIKKTPVVFKEKSISVNVCIGLTSYPELCQDTDVLVSRADNAMYYGKKHGRGRLVVDSQLIDNME